MLGPVTPYNNVDEMALMAMEDLGSRILHLEGRELPCMDTVSDILSTQLTPLGEFFQSLPSSSPSLIEIKGLGCFSVELLVENLRQKVHFLGAPGVPAGAIFPFQLLPRVIHLAYQCAILQKRPEEPIESERLPYGIKIIKDGPFINACKRPEPPLELPIHYLVTGLPHVLPVSWSTKTRLVTDLCDTDFFAAIHERKSSLTPADYPRLMRELLTGIHSIHQKGVVHCDLKEENLLLRRDPATGILRAQIADFGLASLTGSYTIPKGTVHFIAPEALSDPHSRITTLTPANPSRDIWALGIVFWRLLNGNNLIGEPGEPQRVTLLKVFEIMQGVIDLRIDSSYLEPHAADLLKRMLRKNPLERITAEQALSHPYLTN